MRKTEGIDFGTWCQLKELGAVTRKMVSGLLHPFCDQEKKDFLLFSVMRQDCKKF